MQVCRPFSVVWRVASALVRRFRLPWSTASRLRSRPEFAGVNALVDWALLRHEGSSRVHVARHPFCVFCFGAPR